MEITKIALIHGNNIIDGKIRDGEIDYSNCTLEDEYFHIVMILNYLKEHYKDNETLQSYDIYTAMNKIAVTLCNLGDIVFLNTTNYRKDILEKNGRHGIIMMPSELTEKQLEALKEIKELIKNYSDIQIWYKITPDYNCQMLYGNPTVLDEYLNTKINIKRK